MFNLKLSKLVVFILLGCIQPFYGETRILVQENPSFIAAPTWEEVVQYAQETLPLEGYLIQKSDGYVYLKVNDEFIHTLFPMLGLYEEGYKKPPYFRTTDAPGAHISVFNEDEHVLPDEIGRKYHFELKNIIIVRPRRGVSYAVLQVNSAELEKLREKYGLSPKLQSHEFHITLARKKTSL